MARAREYSPLFRSLTQDPWSQSELNYSYILNDVTGELGPITVDREVRLRFRAMKKVDGIVVLPFVVLLFDHLGFVVLIADFV